MHEREIREIVGGRGRERGRKEGFTIPIKTLPIKIKILKNIPPKKSGYRMRKIS